MSRKHIHIYTQTYIFVREKKRSQKSSKHTHLSCWLSTRWYTLQFDFSVFRRYNLIDACVSFYDFRMLWRNEHCDFCASWTDCRHSYGRYIDASWEKMDEKRWKNLIKDLLSMLTHFFLYNFSFVFALPFALADTWHWYLESSSSMTGDMSSEKSPSSSLPTIEYRSYPLRFRWTPRPKSSLVHWMSPVLSTTRHGSVTREPMMAVWSCGSIANLWCCLSWLPLLWYFALVCGNSMHNLSSKMMRNCTPKCLLLLLLVFIRFNRNIVVMFV